MRGLLIGRFQPFHNGHLSLVEQVAADVDEMIIGIGSAEKSHSVRNPFTGGERLQMISNVTSSFETQIYPIPIVDLDRSSVWVQHVMSMCPHFDVVYSNNPLVRRLFVEHGFYVASTPLYMREQYRGTEVRRRMLVNEEWSKLVPEPVRTVINDIKGVQRLQRLSSYTNPPEKNRTVTKSEPSH
ncbi:nicotinamide-nucleotide adenylyltransferase [Haladaptatus sp. R4]|uniref:nicotinamide-nucleotide adenylyltransferase n=1 Tax=Haladaptatus sp. R4 TaxID=1679489 RepID=UPI0009EEC55D